MLRDRKDSTEEDFVTALEKAKELCAQDREKVIAAGGLHILGTKDMRHEG